MRGARLTGGPRDGKTVRIPDPAWARVPYICSKGVTGERSHYLPDGDLDYRYAGPCEHPDLA
jgi:hypothetical protein